MYNTFNEEEKNTYYQDLDNIFNDIKNVINSTDYEKKILKDIEDYMNNNSTENGNQIEEKDENKKSDEKVNNKINNNNIGIEFISGAVSKKNIQHSKYYNSDIISLYNEHENIYFHVSPI